MSGIGVGISPVFVSPFSSSGAPAAPTGLTAVPTGTNNTQIGISWDAVVGATGYIVEYGTNGSDWSEIQDTAATSYNYTPPARAVTHYVRVRAYSGSGESANAQATIKGRLLSLVEAWSMDAASGNETGLVGGTVLVDNNTVTSTTGLLSGARYFTRANNELFQAADNAVISMGAGLDMTIAIWVKPDVINYAPDAFTTATLIYKLNEYVVQMNATGGAAFLMGNGSGFPAQAAAGSGITVGNWALIVGRYNRTHVSCSINGGAWTNTAYSADMVNTANSLQVGAQQSGVRNLTGAIDQIKIWKAALSDAEVAEEYNSGAGVAYPD